jgi:hypothetical protein
MSGASSRFSELLAGFIFSEFADQSGLLVGSGNSKPMALCVVFAVGVCDSYRNGAYRTVHCSSSSASR